MWLQVYGLLVNRHVHVCTCGLYIDVHVNRHVCLHMWFTDTWMNMLIDMCMFAHVVYRYMDEHVNRHVHVCTCGLYMDVH